MSSGVVDIDLGWANIEAALERSNKKSTKVGVVGSAARQETSGGINVATAAIIQEFGSSDGHVPERSFIRSTIDEHEAELVAELKGVAEAVFSGEDVDPRRELAAIGAFASGLIARKISDGLEPALAEATLVKKAEQGDGETRPLGHWLTEAQGHEEGDDEDEGGEE